MQVAVASRAARRPRSATRPGCSRSSGTCCRTPSSSRRPAGGYAWTCGARAHTCEIDVSDTGVGIRPDFLPHLFERFRQADASTTRNHGGLGLGLAIVRHLVELHGGTVAAASDGPGRGATFTVSLPFAPEATGPLLVPRTAGFDQRLRLAGLRVLAVDDDHDSRHLVCELLRGAGAEVQPAASAEEALQALGSSAFDLLVADIAMPGQDGFALIQRLFTSATAEGRPAIPGHRRDGARA